MTKTRVQREPEIHRIPTESYVELVRWVPSESPLQRHIALSLFNPLTCSPQLQLHSHSPNAPLAHLFTYTPPHRITSLKPSQTHHNPFLALATDHGSLQILSFKSETNLIECALESEEHVHVGPVNCVDVLGDDCVTVGQDGTLSFVRVGFGLLHTLFRGSNPLLHYNAVKWASASEFVTAGFGFGLHWWDRRKPGGPASKLNANWANRKDSGMVHSIDIHPSRKHTCLAGGSSGTIFAWDLRWQQQPIVLSGVGMGEGATQSPSESEVWEVQYDHYTKSSNISSVSSSRILPVMFCSEDGILGVLEQGAEPVELLAEPCAINSFDIDRQNPSDVICSLEWESVAILARP